MADELTIDDLIRALDEASPANREVIANILGYTNYGAQQAVTYIDQKARINTRYLHDGVEVTQDSAGTDVGMSGGKGQFDIVNFEGGLMNIDSATNARQVNVRVGGGGADCEFDYLVSTCFASLAGFTEGQTFTALSGCTFKGYSTIQGALTDAGSFSVNDSSTILVCHGTYAEKLQTTSVNNSSLILRGAGQGNTIVRPGTGTGPLLNFQTQINGENAIVINGFTFDSLGMAANTVVLQGGGSTRIKINNCCIRASASTHRGIDPGNSAENGWEISQVNFQGGGTGIYCNAQLSLPNIIVNNCAFESDTSVGIRVGGQIVTINACWFGSTTGVLFPSDAGPVQGVSITGSAFVSCTTGINNLGTNSVTHEDYTITGNQFNNCKVAIDYASLGDNLYSVTIANNTFQGVTYNNLSRWGIRGHATRLRAAVIIGNNFNAYHFGNEITACTGDGVQVVHNVSASYISGNALTVNPNLPDTGIGHAGLPGIPPIGTGSAANAAEPYVVYSATAGLTNERVLTAGTGISIVNAGTDGGALTISATGGGGGTMTIKQVTISLGFTPTGVTV